MASINILNIIPKNITCKFTEPFSFEVIFEVLSELKKEMEWKMIYIGSAEDKKYDQVLETIEIDGPFHLGSMKFEFIGEAPDINQIPETEVLGVTAIILCTGITGWAWLMPPILFRCRKVSAHPCLPTVLWAVW